MAYNGWVEGYVGNKHFDLVIALLSVVVLVWFLLYRNKCIKADQDVVLISEIADMNKRIDLGSPDKKTRYNRFERTLL
ncbi:hypothetical protein HN803_02865 [candidate division WWE3 bacterium]|nr:hypothetical protein [Candidatus Scalindua sp.]MBT7349713.1 hypothetical protein [candidate division WWE3 bacterium]